MTMNHMKIVSLKRLAIDPGTSQGERAAAQRALLGHITDSDMHAIDVAQITIMAEKIREAMTSSVV